MSRLDEVAARIPLLDAEAMSAAWARQAVLTKPTGALGRLEEVSAWAAGVQGRCPPVQPTRIRVVLLAADHGVAAAGVSAYPAEVTAQMVLNFLNDGAAINVLAGLRGVDVQVVDVGVVVDVPGCDASRKVCHGSGRIDVEDALTVGQCDDAIALGLDLADRATDDGIELVIPGDMGIGSTTACAAVVGALLDLNPLVVVGRGTGVTDEALGRKVDAVGQAVARLDGRRDPLEVLRVVGGADLAAHVGLLVGCAARRTPVILDGVVSVVAALVASRLAPAAPAWWLAGHRSTEPAQRAALNALGIEPLVDLGMRLGEGTGALLALPVLEAAIATLADMATFGEAGVSDRDG